MDTIDQDTARNRAIRRALGDELFNQVNMTITALTMNAPSDCVANVQRIEVLANTICGALLMCGANNAPMLAKELDTKWAARLVAAVIAEAGNAHDNPAPDVWVTPAPCANFVDADY